MRAAEIYNGQLYVSVVSTKGRGTTLFSEYRNVPTSAKRRRQSF
jgi:hypothetical protein